MAAFTKERWASGDMKGISVVDANKALNNEWKTLSAAEKKVVCP
jgi:plasmid replication initiation protein